MVDWFSDPGLNRIQRCTFLHCSEVMPFQLWFE